MKLIVHTDGGARGNPGPAAVGVVIESVIGSPLIDHGKAKKIIEFGKAIGETTNNVAEYTGGIEALKKMKDLRLKMKEVQFYLDSMLVVNQINGLFKVKDAKLRELLTQVRLLEQEIGGDIRYTSIPRALNSKADALVNKALDIGIKI